MELPIRFVQLNWRIILGGGYHHGKKKVMSELKQRIAEAGLDHIISVNEDVNKWGHLWCTGITNLKWKCLRLMESHCSHSTQLPIFCMMTE